MSTTDPSLSVKVDVTNPGQFFACCGLLELVHRLWPGAEGWFTAGRFCVSTHVGPGTSVLEACLVWLRESQLFADDGRGETAIRPVRVTSADGSGFTIDWWVDRDGDKTALKLWAGNQTSLKIMRKLHGALPVSQSLASHELFDAGEPLTGRFGVDPRAAWNALDVGFSPDAQDMKVFTYPAVELLAAVGLQGFRPRRVDNRGWCYATWGLPLPPPVARAACAGVVPTGDVGLHRFEIATRGSYKGFNFATPMGDET